MRIDAKFQGDLTGIKLSHNDDTNVRLCTVTVIVGIDEKQAKEKFGHEFWRVAFGSMDQRGEGEAIITSFGYKKLTPALVCDPHVLNICSHGTLKVQPAITAIRPVKDKAEVTVEMRLPILLGESKDLAGALAINFGEVIDFELKATQMPLPLGEAPGGVVIKKGPFGNPQPVLS